MNRLAKTLKLPVRGTPTLAGIRIDPDQAAVRGLEPQTIAWHHLAPVGTFWNVYNEDGSRADGSALPSQLTDVSTYASIVARRAYARAIRRLIDGGNGSIIECYDRARAIWILFLIEGIALLCASAYVAAVGADLEWWEYLDRRWYWIRLGGAVVLSALLLICGTALIRTSWRIARIPMIRSATFNSFWLRAELFDGSVIEVPWSELKDLRLAAFPNEMLFDGGMRLGIIGPKSRSAAFLHEIERRKFPERVERNEKRLRRMPLRLAILIVALAGLTYALLHWTYIPDQSMPNPTAIAGPLALTAISLAGVLYLAFSLRWTHRMARWAHRFDKRRPHRISRRPFLKR